MNDSDFESPIRPIRKRRHLLNMVSKCWGETGEKWQTHSWSIYWAFPLSAVGRQVFPLKTLNAIWPKAGQNVTAFLLTVPSWRLPRCTWSCCVAVNYCHRQFTFPTEALDLKKRSMLCSTWLFFQITWVSVPFVFNKMISIVALFCRNESITKIACCLKKKSRRMPV